MTELTSSLNKVEVVFSFDTTGSMSPCIGQVRKVIDNALTNMFAQMPNLKIGICAHGDYCDRNYSYVTKWHSITNDIESLSNFVRKVQNTGGGDAAECYELVLNEAHSLNWSPDATTRILVLIGDNVPHNANEGQNTLKLDWRKEAKSLAANGITVYPVQCLSVSYATAFYRELAEITGGFHLRLDQFSEIVDLIMAICYKQGNEDQLKVLEDQIVKRGRMSRTLDESFRKLTGRTSAPARYEAVAGDLVPVPPGRFQILEVDTNTDIKSFVMRNDLIFKTGKGFYEFTKTEDIQARKEVVLRHKVTGDMFTGDQARRLIGAPVGEPIRLRPTHMKEYDVFVQSTSVNRKLIGGTRFLYEVDLDR